MVRGKGGHGVWKALGVAVAFALAVGVSAPSAQALTLTTSGVVPLTGNSVSATADLTVSGDLLTIVLTNTTAGGTLDNADTLTDFAFNLTSTSLPSLALSSATGTTIQRVKVPGSSPPVFNLVTTPDVDLVATKGSGKWALATGPSQFLFNGEIFNFDFAITTAGLGYPSGIGALVDGPDYGIVAAGTDLSNDGLSQVGPRVDTTATFVISGFTGLTTDDISATDFFFSWGTAPDLLSNHGIPPAGLVPEPMTLTLLGLGLAGMLIGRRRKS